MLSAGLSLLESLNTTAAVPSAPTKDVLLSHPTMATKGGAYSPPHSHQRPLNEYNYEDIEISQYSNSHVDMVAKNADSRLKTRSNNNLSTRVSLGVPSSRKYSSKLTRKNVHFDENSLLQEYIIEGSDSSDVCSETSSTVSFKNVVIGQEYDWIEVVRRLIREEMDMRESLRREDKMRKVSSETQTSAASILVEESTLPPKFAKPICDCFITEGETAHFVYIIDGQHPTVISWQRNGIAVTRSADNPNIGIIDDEEAGCLLISDAEQQHSGVYSCIAENIYGSVKCTAKLIVQRNIEKNDESISAKSSLVCDTRTFRNQMSQTLAVLKENKAVSSDILTVDSSKDKSNDETGEGTRHWRSRDANCIGMTRHYSTAPTMLDLPLFRLLYDFVRLPGGPTQI